VTIKYTSSRVNQQYELECLLALLLYRSLKKEKEYVRFDVFMVVTMTNTVFWDVTPCGSYKNRRFGGM
jgi:hypothetical protein